MKAGGGGGGNKGLAIGTALKKFNIWYAGSIDRFIPELNLL
jgi:hypothetical protein